ncbi:MAG: hypothetical protein WC378_20530 [Opitutaceae bacterium]|jgi:hypothetical protein
MKQADVEVSIVMLNLDAPLACIRTPRYAFESGRLGVTPLSGVAHLLKSRCPSAIGWFVVSVRVNPIKL